MGICCATQAAQPRELNPVLSDNLEGWDGMGDGEEAQEGRDTCIPVTDSCRCVAETSTIL